MSCAQSKAALCAATLCNLYHCGQEPCGWLWRIWFNHARNPSSNMLKSEACDCLRVVTGLFMAELCKVSRPTAAYGRPSPALQVHCSSQKVHGFVIGFMFDTQILKATGAGLEAPQESPKGTVKPAVLKHLKEALEAIYNAVLDMEFLDIWRYFDSTMSNAKKHQLAALASQHRLQVLEIRPGRGPLCYWSFPCNPRCLG